MDRYVTHATFSLERSYPVPAARVFAAWADPAAKARWFAPGRRAVEENVVVAGGERAEQLGQGAGVPPPRPAKQQVHVAVGEVGRKQVQVVEVGALDGAVQRLGAADERFAAALDLGLDPEQEAGRALRVKIPQQGALAVGGGQVGQVDRGRRLADAALDVVGGVDLHREASTRAAGGGGTADSPSRVRIRG